MPIAKPKSVPKKCEVNRIKAIMAKPIKPESTQIFYMPIASRSGGSGLNAAPINMPGTSKQYAGVVA